ncbi:MAG: hypothetical protein A4E51_01936 [Methanosaeta sp. PtaU1.Bin055]|nr:MAG: hypothetical protein A4E51_01936 [Methanosaeta sp. PtaU1.Bin055]
MTTFALTDNGSTWSLVLSTASQLMTRPATLSSSRIMTSSTVTRFMISAPASTTPAVSFATVSMELAM